jgi:hypothetical protein
MKTFNEWTFNCLLNEETHTTRYSVEINFRSDLKEVMEGFAKIALGFISAALKSQDYHVKQVFNEKPLRILCCRRNWDDGEWVGVVSWNPEHKCFVISKGFYNKDRNTVSIQKSEKSDGKSAAVVAREVINYMHGLKNKPDRHQPKLKRVPLKRGPKHR